MYEEENASPQPSGGGFGRALKNLLLILLFAALAFGLLYLVSERNARRYYLVPEDGNLVVKRGIFFPVGEKPYLPEDPALAEAYAPVPVPEGEPVPDQEAFDEREALNRALFDRLVAWTRPRIESGDPERLEEGIAYLRRAEALPVYDPSRREVLEELEAEVAWYEAQRLVDRSLTALREAVDKLARAQASGSERALDNEGLLQRLRQEVASLRAVRRALARKEQVKPRAGEELEAPEAAGPVEEGVGPAPVGEDAGVGPDAGADAGAEGLAGADAGAEGPAGAPTGEDLRRGPGDADADADADAGRGAGRGAEVDSGEGATDPAEVEGATATP